MKDILSEMNFICSAIKGYLFDAETNKDSGKIRPIIIDIEGTDGSGKQTQSILLKHNLEKAGLRVALFSFPNYESQSSALVKMYLNGKLGDINSLTPYQSSVFFAVDRELTYISDIKPIIDSGEVDVIIFDRYVGSNLIHQGAKIIMNTNEYWKDVDKDELKDSLELNYYVSDWNNFELDKLGLPCPNIVYYLNVPFKTSKKLRADRSNKITGEDKQDIHESNDEYCKLCCKVGEHIADTLNWNVIDCTVNTLTGKKIKNRDTINEDMLKVLLSEVINKDNDIKGE